MSCFRLQGIASANSDRLRFTDGTVKRLLCNFFESAYATHCFCVLSIVLTNCTRQAKKFAEIAVRS